MPSQSQIWLPEVGYIPIYDANRTIVPIRFLATPGQTIFVLDQINYRPNTNSIFVYIERVLQYKDIDYVEADPRTIILEEPLAEGTEVIFICFTEIKLTATVPYEIALRVPFGEGEVNELPSIAERRNKILAFDSFGQPYTVIPDSGSSLQLALDLANATDPTRGASMVGYMGTTVKLTLDFIQQRLIDIPDEVDAAGTAARLIDEHNHDASAHPELSAFITSEANRAENAANLATQYAGAVPYPTRFAAESDIANLPANTKVWVYADPAENFNGLYVSNGVTLTQAVEGAQPASRADIANIPISSVSAASVNGLAGVVLDEDNKEAAELEGDGTWNFFKLKSALGNFLATMDGIVTIANVEFTWEDVPGIAVAVVDEEGKIGFQISSAGSSGGGGGDVSRAEFDALKAEVESLTSSSDVGFGPIELVSNVVREISIDGTSREVFNPSPYVIDPNIPLRSQGKSLIGVWNKPIFGSSRSPVAIAAPAILPSRPAMAFPYDPLSAAIIVGIGQSNKVGAQGTVHAEYAAGFEPNAFMLNGTGAGVRVVPDNTGASPGNEPAYNPANTTDLIPLASTALGNRGTTMMEGMAGKLHGILRSRLGFDIPIVYINGGYGGRLQANMAKGTRIYQNNILAAQRAYDLLVSKGYRPWFPAVTVGHGESDSTHPEYIPNIIPWQSDYEADLQAISGQSVGIPFVCTQASTFLRSSSTTPVTDWDTNGVLAPFLAAQQFPDKFILANPYYWAQMHTDFLHLFRDSHPKVGESLAYAMERALFGQASTGNLQIINTQFNGSNEVVVEFNMPISIIVNDPLIPPPADGNWGAQIFSGTTGLPVGIANRVIVNDTTLRFIASSAIPAGATRAIGFGLYGYTSPKTLGTQARTCIRSAEKVTDFRLGGDPSYHWLSHSYLTF